MKKKILIGLLIIWLGLASIRLFYNYTKIFLQEWKWLTMTSEKKKENIYGDIYSTYKNIKSYTTRDDNILLVSSDYKVFFLLRYLLYPERIYWTYLPYKIPFNPYNEAKVIVIYHVKEIKNSNSILMDISQSNHLLTKIMSEDKTDYSLIFTKK